MIGTCIISGCTNPRKQGLLCAKHHGRKLRQKRRENAIALQSNKMWVKDELAFIELYDLEGKTVGVAQLSSCDIELVKGKNWWMNKDGYPMTSIDKKTEMTLQRFLAKNLQNIDDDKYATVKNNNPLDARRSNILISHKTNKY